MGLSPPIMSDIFSLSENSSYKFGFETVSTIGAILWNGLPAELKNAESLKVLKQKIELWRPNDCSCKICRKFIKNLGYI